MSRHSETKIYTILPCYSLQYVPISASTGAVHDILANVFASSKELFEGACLDTGAVKRDSDKEQSITYYKAATRNYENRPSGSSSRFSGEVHRNQSSFEVRIPPTTNNFLSATKLT